MTNTCIYYPDGHEAHFEMGHPERPERVESIRSALVAEGLWNKCTPMSPIELPLYVMETIHSASYLSLLDRACRRGGHLDTDTYVTQASWKLAHNAAGGATAVARSIWRQESHHGIALSRPPGHHAMRGQGMGFCLLNNIALAAEFLIQEEGAKRIAIVDLDLHHGNGTQDIFYRRSDVLFISTHQRPLYPGTGSQQERGDKDGLGYTANFPLAPGSGDLAFHSVMDEAILPLLKRYQPEILLVSYGFDTHWSDPLGHLLLTVGGYAGLIDKLCQFADENCGGRISLVLEGGYDLDAAAVCTTAVVNVLFGYPWVDTLGKSPYAETDSWKVMLRESKKIWDL